MERRSFIALILGCLGLSRLLPKKPEKVYTWTSPTYKMADWEALTKYDYMGIPVYCDPDCPPGLYIVSLKDDNLKA